MSKEEPGFLQPGPSYRYWTTGRKHRWDPKDAQAKRWTCTRCGCIRTVTGDFPPDEPYLWFEVRAPGEHLHEEPACVTKKKDP